MSTTSAPRTYDPKKYRVTKVEYDSHDFYYEAQRKFLFWWISLGEGHARYQEFEGAKARIFKEIDSKRKPRRIVVHDRHKHHG